MATVFLTREAILQRQDIPTEEVHVPEWGGTVLVRGMTGVQRDKFEASVIQQPQGKNGRRRAADTQVNMDNLRAKLCAWCIVDPSGARVFEDADVEALGAKSSAALSRVYDVAARLSGITEADVDELAEEMVKHPFDETSSA